VINLALWLVGVALVIAAIWRIRRPYARLAELDHLADNALRYEGWRGGRSGPTEGTTGADVMRQLLRRQLMIWTAVGVVGVVLFFAGFAVR
jgi:hypothetical protein